MRYSIFILAVMLWGCGASSQTSEEQRAQPQHNRTDKHPLAYYEATLRPTDYDEEVEVVRRVREEEKKAGQDLVIPKDSLVLQEDQILGFRIQIFSSSSIDDANGARALAQPLFPTDTVYVVYDPPVYKVRMGDYQTRLEANQQMVGVQEKGYADAWVVPDKVIRRRWVSAGDVGKGEK